MGMADEIFVGDSLATGGATITVSDDGSGIDTLQIIGVYNEVTQFSLAWTSDLGVPTSASCRYSTNDGVNFVSNRLIVEGVIENAIGSNGSDFMQGNSIANLLYGDALDSGAGLNDTLWGGAGNDSIYGGAGNDGILGDNDDDRLFGNDGADTISGGSGVDTVEGGTGADLLSGGANAGDTLSYASSAAAIQIGIEFGTTTTGSGGDAAGDQVTGFVNVIGSAFGDRIQDNTSGSLAFGYNDNLFYGGAGRDRLVLGGGNDHGFGGAGDDQLNGGLGRDTLTGGNGADLFVFRTLSDSMVGQTQRDRVSDFSSAQHDQIDLGNIDAEAHVTGNQAFHLIMTKFQGHAGELRLVASGGDVVVMGDIDGDKLADFAILVQGVTSLTDADFVL